MRKYTRAISLWKLLDQLQELQQKVPQDAVVMFLCRSGGRSALAAESLRRLGFAEPLSLAGGFMGWTQGGGEVQA